jgi:B12-binding domain/radical SAM domain protein
MGLFSADLVLLHPPSVYDFRQNTIMFGPISDVVPSSPVFEMYPLGLTAIASHLENEGFNVQIINVACKMLANPGYDVEKEISRLNPLLFGIDLHWLPHAHGSIELAKIVKKYHPDTPVIFGGLSSSYYHEELIEYPWVDMVMRGDSTEEPLLKLMRALRSGGTLADVPNLTWRKPDGAVVVNELSHVPDSIDDIPLPDYFYAIRSVFKYGSLANIMPYADWLDYPMTGLITSRGCLQNCSVCGGSRFSYQRICNRSSPAFLSPEALVRNILQIQQFSKAPIFIVHDLRQGGNDYFERFVALASREKIENELIIELFFPADDDFFSKLAGAIPRFSLEMTLESHVEELRRLNGKFACRNQQVEDTIASALRHGVNKIDIFFMAGIPRQTYQQVLETVDYCRHLLEKLDGDKRLRFFVAPLAPFLDPGCLAFEFPEKYGYKKLCHTFEDHRRALTAPSWKYVLSYETDSMTRDEIVDATYEAAYRLNKLKFEYGIIDEGTYRQTDYKIEAARVVIAEIDAIMQLPQGPGRERRLKAIKQKVEEVRRHSICGKDELKWPIGQRFGEIPKIARILFNLLLKTASHMRYRKMIET